jgi:hypothetical protein
MSVQSGTESRKALFQRDHRVTEAVIAERLIMAVLHRIEAIAFMNVVHLYLLNHI